MTTPRDERVQRGRETGAKVFGGGVALPVPKEMDREWRRFVTATVMGDVWSRPGLGLKNRSMITVAALVALHRPEELKMHLRGALHLGITREEICEIIMHMAIYGGFPVAVDGMRIAAQVFEEEDAKKSKT